MTTDRGREPGERLLPLLAEGLATGGATPDLIGNRVCRNGCRGTPCGSDDGRHDRRRRSARAMPPRCWSRSAARGVRVSTTDETDTPVPRHAPPLSAGTKICVTVIFGLAARRRAHRREQACVTCLRGGGVRPRSDTASLSSRLSVSASPTSIRAAKDSWKKRSSRIYLCPRYLHRCLLTGRDQLRATSVIAGTRVRRAVGRALSPGRIAHRGE